MTGKQWRQKLFPLLFAGALWQRYLVIYSFVALLGAGWLFGPHLLDWWFHQPFTLAWKLITSTLLIIAFALWVALFNLFWVNRATQAHAIGRGTLALLLRFRGKPSHAEDARDIELLSSLAHGNSKGHKFDREDIHERG